MRVLSRFIATAVLGFLLVSGVIHSLAVSLSRGGHSGVLLEAIWLLPVALAILLLALSPT